MCFGWSVGNQSLSCGLPLWSPHLPPREVKVFVLVGAAFHYACMLFYVFPHVKSGCAQGGCT